MLNGCVTTATLPPITEAALRAAAGERSFERGVSYLGAVAGLETVGNQIIATVRGTGDYLVVLTTGEAGAGGGLRGECGCPYGQEGFLCKHCVAVGLTVMRNARSPVPRAAGMGPTRASDLSSWLSSLSREELLAIVCDQVIEDDDWRRQLELRAASAAADVPAISARVAGLLQASGEIDFEDYADLLGAVGLDRLRERVTAAWTANPSGAGEQEALERVLWAAGDIDGLVKVLSADLDSHGLSHLRIAAALDKAGRARAALAWAERGLREPSQPNQQVADYVVERYCSAGQLEDAVTVRRERFSAAASVAAYQQLRDVAERAGSWQPTRQWALGLLRAEATRLPRLRRPGTQRVWPGWVPGAVLIDVLIDDGDIDAAWESAEGLASDAQWQRLADLVLETRPADALATYLRLIETLKKQTGDGAYERIAQLLKAARACHSRLGTSASFDAHVRSLREDQKRKRRLIRILDAHQP